MTEGNEVGRRPILQAMFAVGAASLASAQAHAAAPNPPTALDLTNKDVQSLIFRKLGYAMDDRLGFWHLQGTRYGLVGAELTPFWEMHIGSFFKVRDLPGGSYEVTRMGVTFYTDLETGEYIKKFENPFTKKTIDIEYGRPAPRKFAPPKPIKASYNVMGGKEAEVAPGVSSIGALGPAWIQGDQVWIQQDNLLVAPPGPGERSRVNDLTTYFGPLHEVADPSVKMPAAGHAFTDINDWPAWLQMGDLPGEYYSRGLGYKASSFDEMPETWRKLMLREYPEIARNPGKALLG